MRHISTQPQQALLVLGLSLLLFLLPSCEFQNPVDPIDPEDTTSYTSFASAAELAGLWVRVDPGRVGTCSYEITDSKFTYRKSHEGYILNDTFVCTSHANWDEVSTQSFGYKFNPENQTISVFGSTIASITRYAKDSGRLVSDMFDWDCQLYRVKAVRTEKKE